MFIRHTSQTLALLLGMEKYIYIYNLNHSL